MRLLDAVNTVLPYLGEHPVTDVDTAHPTVDLILKAIERHKGSLLAQGWWFNEATVVLPVNTDGMIDAPTKILSLYGINCDIEINGSNLFDLEENSQYFKSPVKVEIIKDVDFERLPHYAALAVTYKAAIEVYTADFGVENSVQVLQGLAEENRQFLVQENIRKRHYNSSNRRASYRVRNAIRFR